MGLKRGLDRKDHSVLLMLDETIVTEPTDRLDRMSRPLLSFSEPKRATPKGRSALEEFHS